MKFPTQETLDRLRIETPFFQPTEEFPESYVGKHYAEPDPNGKCLCCEKRGTFTWGLAHGVGHCYACGWPARLYHFIMEDEGKERRVVKLLQYHPNEISLPETA